MKLLALLLPLSLAAADTSAWQFRRALTGAPAPISQLTLDPHTLAHSRADLADLRVILDNRELPYVLETSRTPATGQPRPALFIDRAVSSRGLEVTLDTGSSIPHNSVRLETPRRNFRSAVLVEASDDRRNWALIRGDAAIFDFTQDGATYRILDIPYVTSTRRYLRLTLPDWRDPADLASAHLTFFEPASPQRILLAEAKPEAVADHRRTQFLFDLGLAGLPVDQLVVSLDNPAFSRTVQMESSADRKSWQSVASGALARFGGGESLSLLSTETRHRYIRLTVYNGDDAPLNIRSARFFGLARTLTIEGVHAGAELYYGNPEARAPEYDLARRLPAVEPTTLTLAAAARNPNYRPPEPPLKPWTERHPALLWSALLASIAAIGALVWRLIKSLPTSPQP